MEEQLIADWKSNLFHHTVLNQPVTEPLCQTSAGTSIRAMMKGPERRLSHANTKHIRKNDPGKHFNLLITFRSCTPVRVHQKVNKAAMGV